MQSKNFRKLSRQYGNLPIGVSVYDRHAKLVYMNPMALELFSIANLKAVIGMDLFGDPNLTNEIKKEIHYRDKFDFYIDFSFSKIKGFGLARKRIDDTMYLRVNGEKLYKKNNLDQYVLFYSDRSLEKHLENDLINKNEQLSLALEAGEVAVWDWNIGTNHLFISDNFYEWFQMDYHFVGDSVLELTEYIHPHDRLILTARMKEIIHNKENGIIFEFRLMKNPTEYAWLRMVGEPIYVHGEISRVLGVILFIDARKREKDKLREQERTMNALLDNMISGFAVYDMIFDELGYPVDYRFVYVNGAYEKTLGKSKEEVIGKNASEVFSGVSLDRLQAYGGVAKYGQSMEYLDYQKETDRYYETIVYQTKQNQFAMLLTDVTEKKQFEASLKHSEKMSAIGHLAGGIAHDFNNQLMIMGSFCELLMETELEDKAKGYINEISSATVHSKSIIKELLAFSKKGSANFTIIDVNELIRRVIQIISYTFDKNIRIESTLKAKLHRVYGDVSLLENALINLCINAKDAIKDQRKGCISISTQNQMIRAEMKLFSDTLAPGNYLVIKISDNGSGIKDEHLNKIFEPFFTTKDKAGTGMGLPAVFGTFKRHNGSIDVATVLGQGTTITLYVPITEKEIEYKAPVSVETMDRIPKTILIVDDEEIICDVLKEFFEKKNYQVYTAYTPKAARALYEIHHATIDLVLLDVIMPEMNGFQLLEVLSNVDEKIKVIFLSGYSENYNLSERLKDKVVQFIEKPVDLNYLYEAINRS